MNRTILLVALSLISLSLFGQGHSVYSDEDPAFDYIQTYLPEYYYEEDAVGGNKSNVEFSVRTLYNYRDEKTFSYFILSNIEAWGCLDVDEVDSLIAFLERSSDKASFPSRTATLVYNTRRGFQFEVYLYGQSTPHVKLYFPHNGPTVSIQSLPSVWAKTIKKGKEYVKYDTQFVSLGTFSDDAHGYYAIRATARVRSRYVVGSLPRPKALVNEKGKVIVMVDVDQYGNVVSAVPGADGTTIIDEDQWDEARSTAMRTHFNMSANAPARQTGTITYFFEDFD